MKEVKKKYKNTEEGQGRGKRRRREEGGREKK